MTWIWPNAILAFIIKRVKEEENNNCCILHNDTCTYMYMYM